MVELYVDIVTNKITGYNRIIPKDAMDCILVDEKELQKLKGFPGKSYYYMDGEIVEKEDLEGSFFWELGSLDLEYAKLHGDVSNEQKVFMDNILAGVAMEQAAQIAKQNRENLLGLEKQREVLVESHQKASMEAILNQFEEEEVKIDYKYFLSMVAVVRDENDYLEEWIRYHIEEMGFDHFYLYDNESETSVQEYLEGAGFQHLDKVTVVPWATSGNTQQDSHKHFLEEYSSETKWFLAADPDEYVVLKNDSKPLKRFLEENSAHSAIECIWHHFNANGQEKKTEGTDMERFTEEVDWVYGKGRGKRFAQSNRVKSFTNYRPHMRFGMPVENEKDFFQLNHYYTRSYEEWMQKMARGTVVPYAKRRFSEFFELNPDMAYLDTGEDYKQEYGPGKKQMEA